MKKIILPFLLCIFLPLSSHSEDTYLLIEGKKLGTLLFTEDDSKIVPLEINPDTQAEGMIGQPEPIGADELGFETGCEGEHYHGVIENANDPDSLRCGWGKVIKISDSADQVILSKISQLLGDENEAFFNLLFTSTNFENNEVGELVGGASFLITRSINTLTFLKDKIREIATSGSISRSQANNMIRKLRFAFLADREAIRRIRQIDEIVTSNANLTLAENGDLINRRATQARLRIQSATNSKFELIDLLREAGIL